MTSAGFDKDSAWAAIDQEKRRERALRRMSAAAWTVTFVGIIGYGVLVALQIVHSLQLIGVGAASSLVVIAQLMPLLIVIVAVSLLIAAITTIGMFLRQRTASLQEIQLRLAALEEPLARNDES